VVQNLDVSGRGPQDQGDKRTIQVELSPEEPLEFEVLVASPISPNAENVAQAAGSAAVTTSTEEVPEPFDVVLSESQKIWSERWKTDIEIDGPAEDQLAIRSFLFYLRSSIHPDGHMSVSPFALSETLYNGHVFWDADVWVLPALLMLDPQCAQAITQYRIDRFPAAAENFQQALSRFPLDGPNPWRDPNPRSRVQPVQYPWESSVSGLETAPGNSRSQHHISGSVLWGLDQAAAFGLVEQRTLQNIGRSVAEFYRLRAERGENGALEILGTMSPDEFKIADNDLYTNILAEWAIRTFGPDQLTTFKLPRDSKSLLTYENDELKGHKQAAGILAVYPLQHQEAERTARTLLKRFKPAVIEQGPAMTDSIHAIVEARLGDREQAYATWQDSWKQFAHHPLMIFSEKRANDRGYFTTGAGGCLQTVLYGFGGIRIDDSPLLTASLTLPLRNGKHLNVLPSLPPAWKRVTFKNLILPDQRLTLEMDQRGGVRRIAEEN
jgi:trehalose/maltose hydrolase-like predicted phosphorylase